MIVTTFSRIFTAAVAITGLAGLAACSGDADAPANKPAAETPAAAGLTINNARVVLAAVTGNPAAVYFDLSYAGAAPVTITAVTVAGAGMTMIHDYADNGGKMQMKMAGPITLKQGTPVTFAPGGLHVMAMEPSADLSAGTTATVTLTLSDGTSVAIDAPVRAAGEER